LARVAQLAREPLAQEIRLTWWREALDELAAGGRARGHPVAAALGAAVARRALPPAPLVGMIEVRFEAIDSPPVGAAARLRWIDETAGAVMRLAVSRLAPEAADSPAIAPAARAWALAHAAQTTAALSNLAEARVAARAAPAAAFPAIAYATLARAYRSGRAPSMLEKQLRLLGAVLTGRL
jgi:phytoene synthase